MSEPIRLRANAKLNLFLRVVAARDGWHQLETVFHSVALADLLEFHAASPGEIAVEISAPAAERAHLPAPEGNLVTIAAARLARLAPRPVGASIAVTKHIPVGAGLAGGSADAAATLAGLNALWGLGWDRRSMLELADALGSDVPFCLGGGTATGRGRGSDLTPVPEPVAMWFVLGISDRPLITARVYQEWDRVGDSGGDIDAMLRALAGGDPAEISRYLHNDLRVPALSLRRDIGGGIKAMRNAGALGAEMSGSGPTVFGIAADRPHAEAVAQKVRGAFARVEVVASAAAGLEGLP